MPFVGVPQGELLQQLQLWQVLYLLALLPLVTHSWETVLAMLAAELHQTQALAQTYSEL
jgi:hypothetical protein